MNRPSFHNIYMRLAELMSERSTCLRTNGIGRRVQVGCAIVSADFRRVFSVGYNGNAAGLPNQCDSDQVGACGCIHAETNAIVSCTADRDEPKVLFCTHLLRRLREADHPTRRRSRGLLPERLPREGRT